jgi:ribonuclease BN (tRNA processing enzyme)
LRHSLAILLLAAALPARAATDVRLVLLGTAGGPTPKKTRSAPAQALQIGDSIHVVDCGNGVGRQMVLAGLPLRQLRQIFVTHHHSDHVADLVALPLLAWSAGLEEPVTLHGPKPIRKSVKAGLRQFAFDAETRRVDEGRRPLGEIVRVHEFAGDGIVYRDDDVSVRAGRVEHPPIGESYAYRFDTTALSVVISGDTAPSDNLVRLAKGADILVHEVLIASAEEMARLLAKPVDHPLVRHIVRSHTSYRDVGRVAAAAGVKRLVLSHFVPGDAEVDEAAILSEIRGAFSGEVVFGRDLMEIR